MDGPNFISLAELAKHLNVHKTTVFRWHDEGVRGVRLKTIMVGGRRRTTAAALNEFIRQINERKDLYDAFK